MLSKLTLITLHNYSNGAIWGDIDDYIPVGVNKEVLINEILKEDGEFCVIYPDPEFLWTEVVAGCEENLHPSLALDVEGELS